MKRKKHILWILGWTLTVLISYVLGIHQSASRAQAGARPNAADLEYLLPPTSFSEVDNAKATLQAALNQNLIRIRTVSRAVRESRSRETDDPALIAVNRSTTPVQLQELLEAALEEFHGTNQEWFMREEWLWTLKQDVSAEAWVQFYLNSLYRNPTHPLVARFAADALRLSREGDLECEVLQALHHVLAIPMDLPIKGGIRASLETERAPHHDDPSKVHCLS